MVDNIRRADHIGVIKPPGQLRSVERRHQSRREHHHQGKDESPETPDDSLPTQAANPSKNEMDEVLALGARFAVNKGYGKKKDLFSSQSEWEYSARFRFNCPLSTLVFG